MSHPVLAGVDGSDHSLAAAEWAAREARLRCVPLRLVHAAPPLPGDAVPHQAGEMLRRVGERIVQGVIDGLGARYPDLRVHDEQSAQGPGPRRSSPRRAMPGCSWSGHGARAASTASRSARWPFGWRLRPTAPS
ncbi:universal stress protein [Streptomyces sp. NPDC001435]|uniref:universal stress protein n=1 Tax=unclassified Streptomyces TaxID=2593676 RepID=UPI00368B3203